MLIKKIEVGGGGQRGRHVYFPPPPTEPTNVPAKMLLPGGDKEDSLKKTKI